MTTPLRIGALIDFNEWGFHILKAENDVHDDPNDGMWDGHLENEAVIDMMWKNDTSDETTAVEMNWNDNRTNRYPAIPHAVIGGRCSGTSTGVARVTGLEHVPVVSMSSTSNQRSDDNDLKNFFRTVAPDDARGQVGAFVALFRTLGWDRVGICWSSACNLTSAPSDKYDVPGFPPPTWMYVLFPIMASLFTVLLITHLYVLVRKNKHEMQKISEAIFHIYEQLANINAQVEEVPKTWSTSTEILIEVFPEDDQYWSVTRELRKSMDDAWISKVWRVQNKPLWTYYSFHKKTRLNDIDLTELDVWHGTSSLEPSRIYNDTQDGFMTQYSRKGLWGRGLYFATKSSYSHRYAYKPDETPYSDEREMLLAKLLVGNAVQMNRDESPTKAAECSALTVPPINPRTGDKKYNTVKGWRDGSHIWVVYENGRAYPNYLVRYYKGERDPTRTPYKCKKDMTRPAVPPLGQRGCLLSKKRSNVSITDDNKILLSPSAKTFVWEYEVDDGWQPIAPLSQAIIESAYLAYKNNVSPLSTQMFEAEMWTYEVDFDTMSQTNVTHSRHRERKVRRREDDVDVQLP